MQSRATLVGLALLGLGCSAKSEAPGPEASSGGVAGLGGANATGAVNTSGGGNAGATAQAGQAGTATSGGAGGNGGNSGTAGSLSLPEPSNLPTLASLYCRGQLKPYPPSPLPYDSTPVLVPIQPPGGISFLEGPVWLADPGVLLFSEWNEQHRILQLTPPQSVEVFKPMSRTNGLALLPGSESLLVVTEMPGASVSELDLSSKQLEPVVSDYMGQAFVQPNDLAVMADGTLFFTDYQAGRLYRRAKDGTLSLVSSLAHSNGVGISPSETWLYLMADTHAVKYPLEPDGSIGAEAEFASDLQGADGLAIDCAGNVYIAQNNGGSLVVVSKDGQRLGEITGLPKTVTNAAFGGPELKTLYITTSSALYTVTMEIPGLPY